MFIKNTMNMEDKDMLANTLEINAIDGTKMKALLYGSGRSDSIIIHVHGMAGNFYENAFLEVIAAECEKKGVDYLCFNNRGHDYIADCERLTNKGEESFSAGGAYEIFDDCVYDIEGVVRWALTRGYSHIYLEGHSSGANKIAYSYHAMDLKEEEFSKIKGVIFISPCDDVGVFEAEVDATAREKSITLAKRYIDEGKGNELMPIGTFFDYLLSAKTFLDCFVDNSSLDMFPYRKGSIAGCKVEKINVPLLITFGDNGDFILQNIAEIRKIYEKSTLKNCVVQVIGGANHSYKSCEQELAETIITWVKGIVN